MGVGAGAGMWTQHGMAWGRHGMAWGRCERWWWSARVVVEHVVMPACDYTQTARLLVHEANRDPHPKLKLVSKYSAHRRRRLRCLSDGEHGTRQRNSCVNPDGEGGQGPHLWVGLGVGWGRGT